MTPWVTRLIWANVAAFILTTFISPQLVRILWLVPALIPYRPWSVVSYMFLHGGLWHLLFNMIGLYFFGPRLEQRLGGNHFLGLYFMSGITGALLSLFTPNVPIVGASAAVFGVLLGFARYWPRERIYIWGVIPVEARVLVIVLAAASLFFQGSGLQANVAHFAHLGGFLGGYLYLKWREYRSPARRFKRKVEAVQRPTASPTDDLKRWESIPRDDLHPVNRDELDRVMSKIKSSGVGSLTPDERAFLDRFAPSG